MTNKEMMESEDQRHEQRQLLSSSTSTGALSSSTTSAAAMTWQTAQRQKLFPQQDGDSQTRVQGQGHALLRQCSPTRESANTQRSSVVFGVVRNIPKRLKSGDLRRLFDHQIEGNGFVCFHYRHRPEKRKGEAESSTHCMCVFAMKSEAWDQFYLDFNGEPWDEALFWHPDADVPASEKIVIERLHANAVTGLKSLPELNPPEPMPQGNVGTPTAVFRSLTKQCKLPASVFKKLGLDFMLHRSRKFGRVPYTYPDGVVVHDRFKIAQLLASQPTLYRRLPPAHTVRSSLQPAAPRLPLPGDGPACEKFATRHASSCKQVPSRSKGRLARQLKALKRQGITNDAEAAIQQSMIEDTSSLAEKLRKKLTGANGDGDGEGDGEGEEEWDRHISLHPETARKHLHEREKLYERNCSNPWDKGDASGLVHYTDAFYWNQQVGDFDEQTVDDFDVDFSEYYEADDGARGDRSAELLAEMRRFGYKAATAASTGRKHHHDEERESTPNLRRGGIGDQLMARMGWTEGDGLGSRGGGRRDPIDPKEGVSRWRRGIGYRGDAAQIKHHRERAAQRQ